MPGNSYPTLHNAMLPGRVGKGPDSEPPIDLDSMLKLTATAWSDCGKFEGVDLFLADPHTSIDSTKEDIQRLADKIAGYGLLVGSVVARVWPPVGGGSAMVSEEERNNLHRLQYFDHRDEAIGRGWRSRHIPDSDHQYMKHWSVPGLRIDYEHSFIHQAADFIDRLEYGAPAAPTFRDGFATDQVTGAVLLGSFGSVGAAVTQ